MFPEIHLFLQQEKEITGYFFTLIPIFLIVLIMLENLTNLI